MMILMVHTLISNSHLVLPCLQLAITTKDKHQKMFQKSGSQDKILHSFVLSFVRKKLHSKNDTSLYSFNMIYLVLKLRLTDPKHGQFTYLVLKRNSLF